MSDHRPPLDLNCDLAEGEPRARTAALMAHLTSANIACAGHAGTIATMRHAIEIGHSLGLRLGAHPGLPGNFGRDPATELTPSSLQSLLHDQIGRFRDLAATAGATLHHVKLHGTLYHATEQSAALRIAFVEFMRSHVPKSIVFALAGGHTVAAARAAGLTAWDEAFADRNYLANGSLVPRSHPQALITHPATVAHRVAQIARGQPIAAIDGSPLTLHAQTLCLHSDSPHCLNLIHAARQSLDCLISR